MNQMSVQSVRSSLAPLTVSDIIPIMNFTHKALRSLSTSSDSSAISTTSTIPSSSTYSRAWEDMIDRLASHKVRLSCPLLNRPQWIVVRDMRANEKNTQINTIFDLWSGGNIRLNGLDLTLNIGDAEGLFKTMKTDERVSPSSTWSWSARSLLISSPSSRSFATCSSMKRKKTGR